MSDDTRTVVVGISLAGGLESYEDAVRRWRSGELLEELKELCEKAGIDATQVDIKNITLDGGAPLEISVDYGDEDGEEVEKES